MGLASTSKVTFLLAFNVILESSPFAVELLSISACVSDTSAPRVPAGVSRDPWPRAVSLGQKRKTIPAEG